MLNQILNIRAVLERAAQLELTGAGSALLDFKEVHTALMDVEKAPRVMSKPAKASRVRSDDDYNQGGGNIHG